VLASATWSPLAKVVPGRAWGQFDLIEWWDTSTFAVYGGAGIDGVDGAIPFRLRAVDRHGVTVAVTYGHTGLFRPELRSIWPNTGNWGGFNVAVHRTTTVTHYSTTVCLDIGPSYQAVRCQSLPYVGPIMRSA
jgi:hypothetical protein